LLCFFAAKAEDIEVDLDIRRHGDGLMPWSKGDGRSIIWSTKESLASVYAGQLIIPNWFARLF